MGDIALHAGQDLQARAAQVRSEQGAITVDAKRDIEIVAGQASQGWTRCIGSGARVR